MNIDGPDEKLGKSFFFSIVDDNLKYQFSQQRWYMPVIAAFKKLRQEDCYLFEVSLNFKVRVPQKQTNKQNLSSNSKLTNKMTSGKLLENLGTWREQDHFFS